CAVRASTLSWLLGELGALSPAWAEFWCRDDHLGHLVEVLLGLGEEAGPLWDLLCGQLDRGLLLSGDPYQKAVLLNLTAAAGRPPSRGRGGGAAARVAAWPRLRDHVEKACATPEEERQPVIDACRHCGVDALDLLRGYFERFVLPHPPGDELLA